MARLDRAIFPKGQAYPLAVFWWYLGDRGAVCLVAEDAAGLAGFAIGRMERWNEGHVVTLDVDPSRRRAGLGARLLRELEAELLRRGARRMVLEVEQGNEAATALYRGAGYEAIGVVPNYYRRGSDGVVMVKEMRAK